MNLMLSRAEWDEVLETARVTAEAWEKEFEGFKRKYGDPHEPSAGPQLRARLGELLGGRESRVAEYVHTHIVSLGILRIRGRAREELVSAPGQIRAALTPLLGGIEIDSLGL